MNVMIEFVKNGLKLFIASNVLVFYLTGLAIADEDLNNKISAELKSDPGLESDLLSWVQIESNNGYVVLKADCNKYPWRGGKSTLSIPKVRSEMNKCRAWLYSAAETARNVQGVKKVTVKDKVD